MRHFGQLPTLRSLLLFYYMPGNGEKVNKLLSLFWNRNEKRLRLGIRSIIQLTLFFIMMKSLSALLNIPSLFTSGDNLSVIIKLALVRLFRVLISVYLAMRFLDHRSFSGFGLKISKEWWIDLGFGILLGAVLFSGVFVVELSMGWVVITETFHSTGTDNGFVLSTFVFIILFISVGFSEELLYRGYQMTNIAEGFNLSIIGHKWATIIGLVLSLILFGSFHLGSPNINSLSLVILVSWALLSGVAYFLTGKLAISIGMHISWNFFQGNVFGFPVSGTTFSKEAVTFISIDQKGPDLWTGGSYGPESGLIGLLAIIAGLLILLAWVHLRQGKLEIMKIQRPVNKKFPKEIRS